MGWTRYFRRRHWDEERAQELASYLEEETADNIGRGMSPADARRAASRKLGNPTRIREDIYLMNSLPRLESIWQDFRFGARLLRKNPTFTLVAVLTLALGTGANAAVFQLVNAIGFRTLPVASPHELVELRVDAHDRGRTGRFMSRRPMFTHPLWEILRDRQEAFASLLAWSPTVVDLAGGGEVRPGQAIFVSGGFFDLLGIRAAHGRVLSAADDERGCSSPGAVLSDGFWRREYGGDPDTVGGTILLDGRRFDIIGVAWPGFTGVEVGRAFDVAVPLCSEPLFRGADSGIDRRDAWFLAVMGRLKPGWTGEQASAHLRAISPGIFRETLPPNYIPLDAQHYLEFELMAVKAQTGVSGLRTTYATPLGILLGVTGLVLLIACANLANLMLARATARAREVGVRLAIGASRARIVRQLLSESLLLAVVGAAAGLVLAQWAGEVLVGLLSTDRVPLFLDLGFDWRVFAFTAAVAAAACLLFGLAPALRATRAAGPASVLGSRGTSEGAERFTLRRILVVVQVALSLVLVVGALLFARSLRNLTGLDPGFREEGVLIASLDLRRAAVPPGSRRAVFDALLERFEGLPGAERASEAVIAPMTGSGWNNAVIVDGVRGSGFANFNAVGPGYFHTLGTRFVAGRDFTSHDGPGSVPVAIVNELFVQRYLGGADPIGRVFHWPDPPAGEQAPRYQVVGVVENTKYADLREELPPIAYVPARQQPDVGPSLEVILHATAPAPMVAASATQAIREVNPAIAVRFDTMERLVHESLTAERLMATLSGVFGTLAMLIATVGLYGVVAYMVARRRMEIGIRMALGADRAAVVRMVVGEAARLLAVGLAVGTLLAVLAAHAARSLLYGVVPWDPPTLALAIAVLGGVSLAASWVPADRASRTAPTVALRAE